MTAAYFTVGAPMFPALALSSMSPSEMSPWPAIELTIKLKQLTRPETTYTKGFSMMFKYFNSFCKGCGPLHVAFFPPRQLDPGRLGIQQHSIRPALAKRFRLRHFRP